jgi:hypothetical protein
MFASPDNDFNVCNPVNTSEDCDENDGVGIFALPMIAATEALTVSRLTVFDTPCGR